MNPGEGVFCHIVGSDICSIADMEVNAFSVETTSQ
jgi:hypothetical protein